LSDVVDEVFPKENVKTALKTIFENNIKQFCNGEKGAVNGWIPEQGIDKSSMQSEEVRRLFNVYRIFLFLS
jgi:non-lysosomal glucosylceramidase